MSETSPKTAENNTPDNSKTGWIGVDLDGTLARYDSKHGINIIGDIIDPIAFRIQQWLDEGIDVRIFTARASKPDLIPPVQEWLLNNNLPALPVTNRKDFDLLQIWDDRVVQIENNSGEVLTPKEYIMLDINGWIGVELDGTLAHFDKGQDPLTIGEPIVKMRLRVQQWMMVGIDVRLFTARATLPSMLPHIESWLKEHNLSGLPVTAEKDFSMSQFWDDRGVHVVSNTGEIVTSLETLTPDRKYR